VLQIARGRRLCYFVDEGLIEKQRLFHEKVFSISVELAWKYRHNNIQCTKLSSHSAKHQQQARIIAALSPSDKRKANKNLAYLITADVDIKSTVLNQ